MRRLVTFPFGLLATATLFGCGAEGAVEQTGTVKQPLGGTSSDPAYLVPLKAGVSFQALLTVGDSPAKGTYPMVGIPDGLGAYGGGGGSFTLLMNHELRNTQGAVRAHGATGAFVSKWKIDGTTGQILKGEDLMQSVVTWNTATSSYDPPAKGVAMARYCSANLAPNSAFFDDASGLGYDDHLFMNGEENGFSRAFAHDVQTGISYELPRIGKISYENVVARPSSGVSTVVVGLDDDGLGNSEVVVYVGTKTAAGSPVDMAGLTNGSLFGVRVQGYPTEPAAGIPSGTAFDAHEYGDVSNVAGAALQAASTANGVTGFNRSEDGAWNPVDGNEFIFVTTASFTTSTRLWRLNFQDATNPAAGGSIDLLVDGATSLVDGFVPKMFDNMTITKDGRYVYMQEDPGNQAHLAKIWRFDLTTNTLELVAEHDRARFSLGGSKFITNDVESWGIIDASDLLGPGKFLLDIQVHKANPNPALVELGQLSVMTVSG